MNNITKTDLKILSAIKEFYNTHNFPPTIREIAKILHYKSTKAVFVHLKKLEQAGYIKRNSKARNIIINRFKSIPILGNVSAGKPLLSEEFIEDSYNIPIDIKGDFFLKIKGESMINAGLENGDLVLVRITDDLKNGQIGVFMLNGETTIKRFIFKRNSIILKAENPKYKNIEITKEDDFRIIGKIIGHMKLL